jgi:RNA polymerase sigma factor (sigma-70 family)
MLNSGKTVDDVLNIVNYAIGKMRKHWNISESEIEDLQQDGYLAAIQADRAYDPRRAAWSTWILTRVRGQLKTSIVRLRNFGITGRDTSHIKTLSEVDGSIDELVSPDTATEEAADISGMMTTLLGCVSERSKRILHLYYGLDGQSPSLSATQLAKRLGYSKKHAFSLLQKAQQEARSCLGSAQ